MIMSNTIIKPILKRANKDDNMLDWKSFSWRMGKGGGGGVFKDTRVLRRCSGNKKIWFHEVS